MDKRQVMGFTEEELVTELTGAIEELKTINHGRIKLGNDVSRTVGAFKSLTHDSVDFGKLLFGAIKNIIFSTEYEQGAEESDQVSLFDSAMKVTADGINLLSAAASVIVDVYQGLDYIIDQVNPDYTGVLTLGEINIDLA